MIRFVPGVAIATLAALPAEATVYTFTFTGGVDAVFQIDDAGFAPIPRTSDSFAVLAMVSYDGGPAEQSQLAFYDGAIGGGVDIAPSTFSPNEFGVYSPTGHQLFGGTIDAPTFDTGSFDLYDYFTPDVTYRLEITTVSSGGVPEPMTWALMATGFGLSGVAIRRQRRHVAA